MLRRGVPLSHGFTALPNRPLGHATPDGGLALLHRRHRLATFIEDKLDYGVAFKFVQDLVEKNRDEHHDIYLAGQPALTGWVYFYKSEMFWIFAITLGLLVLVLVLVLALVLYMRNIVCVVTPIVTSSVAAIWGFGFVVWLKSPIEPLLMVVPLLLTARSFSHGVQFTERFYEVYARTGQFVESCNQPFRSAPHARLRRVAHFACALPFQ